MARYEPDYAAQIVQVQPIHGTEQIRGTMREAVQLFCDLIGKQKNESEHNLIRTVTEFLE